MEAVEKATTRKPTARIRKSRKAGSAEENRYKCPHCDLAFSDESLMLSHRDDEHEEEYQYECGQCDKLFKDLQSLKSHFFSQHTVSGRQGGMDVEAELPVVQGEFCHQKDLNKSSRVTRPNGFERTESQAVGVTPVKLEVLNSTNNDSNGNLQDDEGALYKCRECGKFLKSRKTLREHQKRHVQVVKFICQIAACSKGFKTRHDRDRHEIRVHVPVEQRPNQIVCTVCGKRIAHGGLIADHMRTHTGERPFTCELCGKSFAQKNTLKDHLKSKLHGGQGLSHRNKKKKKAVAPKKKVQKKVEDESYEEEEEDDGSESSQDEDNERSSFQSGSEMTMAPQSQSVAQSLVINQPIPPPPPLTSPMRQTRSMINQQFPHQYLQQTIPSGNMDSQPQWRIQQQPINPNNIVYSNHPQQRSLVQEQLVQHQQQQSVIEQTGNVILHMPTLTLHDAFRNAYPTS